MVHHPKDHIVLAEIVLFNLTNDVVGDYSMKLQDVLCLAPC